MDKIIQSYIGDFFKSHEIAESQQYEMFVSYCAMCFFIVQA